MVGRFLLLLILLFGLSCPSYACHIDLLTLPGSSQRLNIWLVAELTNGKHAIGMAPYILRRHKDISAKFDRMGLEVSRFLGGGELKMINLAPHTERADLMASNPTSSFLKKLRDSKDKRAPDEASHKVATRILSTFLRGGVHLPFFSDYPHLAMRLNRFACVKTDSLTHDLLNSISYLLEPLQYFDSTDPYPSTASVREAMLATTPPSPHPNIELVSILVSLLENDGIHERWFAKLVAHIENVKDLPLTHAEYKEMYDYGFKLKEVVRAAAERDEDDILVAVID